MSARSLDCGSWRVLQRTGASLESALRSLGAGTRPARRRIANSHRITTPAIEVLESRTLLSAVGLSESTVLSEIPEGRRGRFDADVDVPPRASIPYERRLLVKFTDEAIAEGRPVPVVRGTAIVKQVGSDPSVYLIYVSVMLSQEKALKAYEAHPLVEYAGPDGLVKFLDPIDSVVIKGSRMVLAANNPAPNGEPVARFEVLPGSESPTENAPAVVDELLVTTIGTLLATDPQAEAATSTKLAAVSSETVATQGASLKEPDGTQLDRYFAAEDPIALLLSPALNYTFGQRSA